MITETVNHRIAARVRQVRTDRGLTLDALADASGVSRSTISLIERGESSPTAIVLEKLSMGLGVALAALFDPPSAPPDPVSRSAGQDEWCDPGSGYRRQNVSPAGFPSPMRIVDVALPPGARVAYETADRPGVVHHQVWVLDGTIRVTLGDRPFELETGDCLAFVLDRPVTYHNPTPRAARYAVIVVATPIGG